MLTNLGSSFLKVALAFLTLTVVQATDAEQQDKDRIHISGSPISKWLGQSTITSLTKDHYGFLWIGTQHGLYMFNGAKVKEFSSKLVGKNRIAASDIIGLATDAHGQVIASSFGGGIIAYEPERDSFIALEESEHFRRNDRIRLIDSGLGHVWAYSDEKILLLRTPDEKQLYTARLVDLSSLSTEIGASTTDQIGNFYYAAEGMVYRVSASEPSISELVYQAGVNEVSGDITVMTFSPDRKLYIGTEHGDLFSVNFSNELATPIKKIGHEIFDSITALRFFGGNLWIGTNVGLFEFDGTSLSKKSYRHENSGLASSHIVSLFDENEFMWIGTYQGLSTLSSVPFETFNEGNSGIFDDVMAFDKDSQDRLWVGTFNGLYIYDSIARSHKRFEDIYPLMKLGDPRIMTLAFMGSELWLGFRTGGVQVINIDSSTDITPKISGMQDWDVTKILHMKNGSTWVATFGDGLFSIDQSHATSFLIQEKLREPKVTIMLQSNSGILVGSEHKVFRYDPELDQFQYLPFIYVDTDYPPLIFSISEAPNRDLWIGTKNQGIFVWRKVDQENKVFVLSRLESPEENLPTTVYQIVFDRFGHAWCSTQTGIYKINVQGKVLGKFNAASGLQGNDFNFGASLIDSSGDLFFGGSNGYTQFSPDEVGSKDVSPRMLFTGVLLSRESGTESFFPEGISTVELAHTDHHITFEFAVLDFLNPEKNQYRYTLEGFDHGWIENGTRNTATYTNLPPGDYVLRVQGSNSAGVWNREGLTLNVHVLPPPWRTWWAYCFYLLLSCLLFSIMVRIYNSRMIERRATERAQQMRAEAERAEDELQEQLELQDELVKSVYGHNVATLGLIGDLISTRTDTGMPDSQGGEVAHSVSQVNALIELESCVYQQEDCLMADMHKFTDLILSRLLLESPIEAEAVTTINEVSAQPLWMEQASPLAIALYELLENAIQHAFADAHTANYLHITLTRETSQLGQPLYTLVVEDNGIGMPETFDPDILTTPGLAIVQAMTDRLKGKLAFRAGNGTRITLEFPGHPD